MSEIVARLQESRLHGPSAWLPTVVRVVTGLFFVSTGIGKFADHAKEVADFRGFEVPWPEVAVPVVGTIELVGGLLLIVGLLTRPAALMLAFDMIGALATAGRVEGGSFHLVYPPVLLVLMLFLCWAGPGHLSLDERMAGRRADTGGAPPSPATA
ncbi:MAG: DoxX family protein [Acidimicrobiia bacterium]|nr:DoxX family protein [Acidimicrobiia bacterium]